MGLKSINVNKCKGCKFFKRHYMFTENDVETLSISCDITGLSLTPNSYGAFNFDSLTNQCPFNRLNKGNDIQKKWNELYGYIEHEYETCCKRFNNDKTNLKYIHWKEILEDIMCKIKSLNKENKGE